MKNIQLKNCTRCPRLVEHRQQILKQYPKYQHHPIGAWGDPNAKVLIVGLAPGLHGAARTGKAFVGDASGDFLFAGLYRAGFSNQANPQQAKLNNVRITNVVKCLPPGNNPSGPEQRNCANFLQEEIVQFCPSRARRPRCIICLGGLAFGGVAKALELKGESFSHNASFKINNNLHLVASFHPSRLNVNTGRITPTMLDDVFLQAKNLIN